MPDLITASCFSFQFYIKPQHAPLTDDAGLCCFSFQFYIKPQRFVSFLSLLPGCFSFQFYIKPQPIRISISAHPVVSHSNSTSNHNRKIRHHKGSPVVSHSNSTSNHNRPKGLLPITMLFLIPILHQTTTGNRNNGNFIRLFLIPILHQTTTSGFSFQSISALFLIPILHQTTTCRGASCRAPRCFSFQFYIKPQPRAWQ